MAVLVMAAIAVVSSTATAGRSGNPRIRWSNHGNNNNQRRSGAMIASAEGKSRNIYNYHLIAQHVMKYWTILNVMVSIFNLIILKLL
jgi:hypothetical protein